MYQFGACALPVSGGVEHVRINNLLVILTAFKLSDGSLGRMKEFQILIQGVHYLTAENCASKGPLLAAAGSRAPRLPVHFRALPRKRSRRHMLIIDSATAVENHVVRVVGLLLLQGLSVGVHQFVLVLIYQQLIRILTILKRLLLTPPLLHRTLSCSSSPQPLIGDGAP